MDQLFVFDDAGTPSVAELLEIVVVAPLVRDGTVVVEDVDSGVPNRPADADHCVSDLIGSPR